MAHPEGMALLHHLPVKIKSCLNHSLCSLLSLILLSIVFPLSCDNFLNACFSAPLRYNLHLTEITLFCIQCNKHSIVQHHSGLATEHFSHPQKFSSKAKSVYLHSIYPHHHCMASGENSFHVYQQVNRGKKTGGKGELDNHLQNAISGTTLRYSRIFFQFFLQQLGGQILLFLL